MRLPTAIAAGVIGRTPNPLPVMGPGVGLALGVALDVAAGASSPFPVIGPPVGLSLGVALDVAAGEAVSAGPVWDVSRYLLADGAVSLTGPTINLTGAHEWVVCWDRPTAEAAHWLVTGYGSANESVVMYADASRIRAWSQTSGVVRDVQVTAAVTGLRVTSLVVTKSGSDLIANIAHDGAAPTTNTSGMPAALSTAQVRIAKYSAAAAANLKIRWVGLRRTGVLSAGSRTAIAGARLSDPRDLSAEAFTHLWPMGLVYDSGGGVWKVRDLITTDGTTDATVTGGDNTDFPAV